MSYEFRYNTMKLPLLIHLYNIPHSYIDMEINYEQSNRQDIKNS